MSRDETPSATGERGLDCPDGCDVCDPTVVTPDAGGVKALDRLLDRVLADEYGDERWSELGSLRRISRAILASDWLANHVAAVREADRAEERERIAQAIEAAARRQPRDDQWMWGADAAVAARIARHTPEDPS